MKIALWISLLLGIFYNQSLAQNTVPTAIIVENSAYTAPVYGAEIEIVMKEIFGNEKRPISTLIGHFKSNKKGIVTVSLQPNKSYTLVVACKGFHTQITKISTTNFSRTRENRKGISLRPRNILAVHGQIISTSKLEIVGVASLTNNITKHTEITKIRQNGSFFFKVLQGADYNLRVVVDEQLDSLITLTELELLGSSMTNPYRLNFKLNAPQPNYKKGDTLKLNNMLFAARTTRIKNEIWLDTLGAILEKNPSVCIKINVYTDARRSDRINYILAKKRIAIIKEKLITRGVWPQQYLFEAKGEDDLTNKCKDGVRCSREQHERNNRAVLIVARGSFLWNQEVP